MLGWVLLCGTTATAQIAKAPGFKIGEGRLHPYFELDARFDSLVGRFTPNVDSPEFIFHFRPGLKFDLENASTLVSFNGFGEYLWFTGLLSPGSTSLSRFQGAASIDAKFNRDGVAEFDIGDNLVRSDRTQMPTFAIGVVSLFNNLYLAVPIRPGGRALEVTPRAAWSVEFFEPLLTGIVQGCSNAVCDPSATRFSNYSNLNFGLNGRWKFLPKTALILDVNADWRTYFAYPGMQDKVLFRSQAGIAGLITPRISVTLMAGYLGDFTVGSIHTFIANAEFAYTVSEQSRIAIGYSRNAIPVPIVDGPIVMGGMPVLRSAVAMDDRGYLRGGLGLLGGRLLINGQVSADYFTFVDTVARNDFLFSVNVGPQVIVTSWFDVSASYTFSYRSSSVAQLNFPRHEAMLRLNFHY